MKYLVDHKLLFGIIVFLLLLNLFLAYSNITRQNRINILNGQVKYYEREEAIHQYFNEILYVKNSFEPKKDLSLILIFPHTECISCIKSEMANLNRFHEKFSDRTNVYYVGGDSLFLNHAGINFPYKTINSVSAVLPNFFRFNNPLRVIVDKKKYNPRFI